LHKQKLAAIDKFQKSKTKKLKQTASEHHKSITQNAVFFKMK